MAGQGWGSGFLSLLTLRESRRFLRPWVARFSVVGVALSYVIVSMIVGQMLELSPTQQSLQVLILSQGTPAWDFPALLVIAPWGVLALPLLATITMVLVSIGVGIGVSVAIRVVLQAWVAKAPGLRRSSISGSGAAAAPAITGLATLGACCCTSCVTVGGVAVVAAVSGTGLLNVLANNWYLSVFELAVVGFGLLVQERALRRASTACDPPPPLDRRFGASVALRLALMMTGITWSLAMFIEWGSQSPLTGSAPIWYHWSIEHQLLSLTAIAAALVPGEFADSLVRFARRRSGWLLRVPLLVAGLSWGTWVPPELAATGLGGFLNELFGFIGVPGIWGAISPGSSLGAPLYFHWVFQHLLLSSFAITLAAFPERALAPILWSVRRIPRSSEVRSMENPPIGTPSTPRGPSTPIPTAASSNSTTALS